HGRNESPRALAAGLSRDSRRRRAAHRCRRLHRRPGRHAGRGEPARRPPAPQGQRALAPGRPALAHHASRRPGGDHGLRPAAESGAQRFVPVTVRSASTAGKVGIKNAVETWQAYNAWGGYDLYHGPGGPADYRHRSLAVSLDRPYDGNGAPLFLYNERKLVEL